ncbi:MAG: hypothetical protein RLZZ333_2022 [Bacteroidota bacterium]
MRKLQAPNSTILMRIKFLIFGVCLLLLNQASWSQNAKKNISMLVYTKNGKGFVHDNIPSAVEALKLLAKEEKFNITVSDDPSLFTEENLKQYTLLVFPSTNNDIFDTDAQRLAFRRYIEAGGALVGLHSVTGTERNWKWFKMLIGCTFSWHAKFQSFSFQVLDKNHPSMKNVPAVWEREDECYFGKELYPVTNVLLLIPPKKNLSKKMQVLMRSITLQFGTMNFKEEGPGFLPLVTAKRHTRTLFIKTTCCKA